MATRVIIKNLPRDLDEHGLKRHLSTLNCPITDIKLPRKENGKSRCFAFVGFGSVDDAAKVIKYFNNSFIGSIRICVEPSSGLKKKSSAVPMKTPESHALKYHSLVSALFSKEDEKDPELKAFLAAMKPPSKHATWSNDDVGTDVTEPKTGSDDEYDYWDPSKPQVSSENQSTSDSHIQHQEVPNESSRGTDEKILDTGRLFLRSLSYECKVADIERLFSPFGPITEVSIPITMDTNRPKGFGFVQFAFPEDAIKAFTCLNNSIFQGRPLRISPGLEKPHTSATIASFKDKKREKQKSDSLKSTRLSSLFLSPDAVMEAISAQLGVSKRTLLLDSDAASKIAVAETLIIEETKKFMAQHGINDEDWDDANTVKSKRVLLIKNIPFVEENEITSLIGRIGGPTTTGLVRLLIPPTRCIAIGEWQDENSALVAFKALSYKRFRSAPLYIEWAPLSFEKSSISDTTQASLLEKEEPKTKSDNPNQQGPSLFVKNLNFHSTSESLLRVVNSRLQNKALSARIITKNDPTKGILSCGFGFLAFSSSEECELALPLLSELVLDGHRLQFQYAANTEDRTKQTEEATSSTILVKNLAFEATSSELRKVFSPFGQVKRIRLPKKPTKGHRGFAFVEMVSKADAEFAFKSLRHSHLYGRHLVLEWADSENNSNARMMSALAKQASSFIASRPSALEHANHPTSDEDENNDV